MQSKAKTVNEYLAEIPADRREALTTLRLLIKKSAPAVEESMQYGMPSYALNGMLLGLASQKHHMAFYCCDDVIERYRPRLDKLSCGKGCIRFRRIGELPLDLISEMLRNFATPR